MEFLEENERDGNKMWKTMKQTLKKAKRNLWCFLHYLYYIFFFFRFSLFFVFFDKEKDFFGVTTKKPFGKYLMFITWRRKILWKKHKSYMGKRRKPIDSSAIDLVSYIFLSIFFSFSFYCDCKARCLPAVLVSCPFSFNFNFNRNTIAGV